MISDLTVKIKATPYKKLTEAEKVWLCAEVDGWSVIKSKRGYWMLIYGKDVLPTKIYCNTHNLLEAAESDIINDTDYTSDIRAIRRLERKLHSWTWKYWDFVGEEMGWFDDRIDPTIYFLADESKLFNALARTIHAMHQEPK